MCPSVSVLIILLDDICRLPTEIDNTPVILLVSSKVIPDSCIALAPVPSDRTILLSLEEVNSNPTNFSVLDSSNLYNLPSALKYILFLPAAGVLGVAIWAKSIRFVLMAFAVRLPVVVKFSLSNDIAPLVLDITPAEKVKSLTISEVWRYAVLNLSVLVPISIVSVTGGLILSKNWINPVLGPTPSPLLANRFKLVFAEAPPYILCPAKLPTNGFPSESRSSIPYL
jgi:hypothetical protein